MSFEKFPGAFVISLDFEIMWGVFDKPASKTTYQANLHGVRKAIPAMLKLFRRYDVHTTFATVGLLFAESKKELLKYTPAHQPDYFNKMLSPYVNEMKTVGENEEDDPLHYAFSLIKEIASEGMHELASHTFCHYYCLEEGQTRLAFEADIGVAVAIAKAKGFELKSMVFPRNQFNKAYLEIIKRYGFKSYRGNENSWMYDARNRDDERFSRRIARLVDTYLNISGHHIYRWEAIVDDEGLYNIPASRFLRPYSKKLSFLEYWRLRRIKRGMLAAAKQRRVYHLWWHPHNFGTNLDKNIRFLEKILQYYQYLREKYRFESLTMSEAGEIIAQNCRSNYKI